jgi:hypothetical protein
MSSFCFSKSARCTREWGRKACEQMNTRRDSQTALASIFPHLLEEEAYRALSLSAVRPVPAVPLQHMCCRA